MTSRPNASSACASLTPPRLTQGCSGPVTRTSACSDTIVPALAAARPSTSTLPARISACARSRDSTSPRRTSSVIETQLHRCGRGSRSPLDDPAGDGRQVGVGEAGARPAPRRRAPPPSAASALRSREAEQRRIGRLAGGGVLARRLAERRPRRPRRRARRRRSGRRARSRRPRRRRRRPRRRRRRP